MVDFGKELLLVDNYNIPWLVWIQMIVFILLLLLLFVIGIFSSDIVDNGCSSADSVPSTSSSSISGRFLSENPISKSHYGLGFSINSSLVQSNQDKQIRSSQSMKGEITPAVTRRITRTEETEGSLDKDSSQNLHHPCSFFKLAGSAFLKCFGLDRSTEDTRDSLRQESKKER